MECDTQSQNIGQQVRALPQCGARVAKRRQEDTQITYTDRGLQGALRAEADAAAFTSQDQ